MSLARFREGHELAVTPAGEAVPATSSTASGSDIEVCYHGAIPWQLQQILQGGLLPNKGKQDIVGVWTSPHIHTAVEYPMAPKGAQGVTPRSPAVRVILKLEVARAAMIRRMAGHKNRAGVPVNCQWPVRPEGIRILSIHLWRYDGHASGRERWKRGC